MLAMFSDTEITMVWVLGLAFLLAVAVGIWIVYRVIRRAARDGARDANRKD